MKKPKLIFKVNQDYTAKVYVGGKWQKDVCELEIHGEPYDFEIKVKRLKRNSDGVFFVENDENGNPEIATVTKTYRVKRGK